MASTITILCDVYEDIDVLSKSEEKALELLNTCFRRGLYSEREYESKREAIVGRIRLIDTVKDMVLEKIRLEPK